MEEMIDPILNKITTFVINVWLKIAGEDANIDLDIFKDIICEYIDNFLPIIKIKNIDFKKDEINNHIISIIIDYDINPILLDSEEKI